MKKYILWTVLAALVMVGCPWLLVKFAGSSGMISVFILFFAVNPLFSLFCGVFAGQDIRRLWALPLLPAVFFLIGTQLLFEPDEPAFLLYAAIYLALAAVAMAVRALLSKRLR